MDSKKNKKKSSAEAKIHDRSSKIEEQILNAQKKHEEKVFLEELGKRISIARDGKMQMEKRDYAEALSSYRRFINLTAKALKVEVDGLSPSLFEEKMRTSESLLMSAVFLDLMKMLDRVSSAGARQERALYHKLFVKFTLGQSFQGFAAENLRKYISSSQTLQNKKEFNATYSKIQNQKFCFVATWAFGNENAPEVIQLRNFRDDKILHWPIGPALVEAYYFVGPGLSKLLNTLPGARKIMRSALLIFVRHILSARQNRP